MAESGCRGIRGAGRAAGAECRRARRHHRADRDPLHRDSAGRRHPLLRREWWQRGRRAALRGRIRRALQPRASCPPGLCGGGARHRRRAADGGQQRPDVREGLRASGRGAGTKRDLLILHSTSGRSPNLLAAAKAARAKGAPVIALLGRDGGPLRELADLALVVDHDDTGRIQLVHMAAQHVIVGDGREPAHRSRRLACSISAADPSSSPAAAGASDGLRHCFSRAPGPMWPSAITPA